MNGFYTVAVTVCAAAIACAILSRFVTDGSLKRILSLVMGAFMVCSLIIPVKNALKDFSLDLSSYPSAEQITSTADEAVNKQVVAQTRQNLENTLGALLLQNGIKSNKCEVILADSGENRIIISAVSIYIDKDNADEAEQITELCRQNLGIEPNIITE
ncbi:MAG: stage III sporulation protein AF [Ruminococcus sp.]|nr:stage III sporulation protein AF [Ruminococcus sp.]